MFDYSIQKYIFVFLGFTVLTPDKLCYTPLNLLMVIEYFRPLSEIVHPIQLQYFLKNFLSLNSIWIFYACILRSYVLCMLYSIHFWLNTFFTIGRHALNLTARYLTDAIIINLYNEVLNAYNNPRRKLIKSLQYNILSIYIKLVSPKEHSTRCP